MRRKAPVVGDHLDGGLLVPQTVSGVKNRGGAHGEGIDVADKAAVSPVAVGVGQDSVADDHLVKALSGQHALDDLLAAAGLARSSHCYSLAHPARPTRPKLWDAAREVFSRTANGCGHRQVAMCLRAEEGERVSDKTVLKTMGEMGLRCGIRRETDYRRYSSYRGPSGGPSGTPWAATSRRVPPGRRWARM